MSFQALTGDIRNTLRVFSWARAQHRLYRREGPATFSAAADLISAETGIERQKVTAVLGGGFSSRETQDAVARWNGLKLASKHGAPVLVVDPDASSPEGPRGHALPLSVEEALRRVDGRARHANL